MAGLWDRLKAAINPFDRGAGWSNPNVQPQPAPSPQPAPRPQPQRPQVDIRALAQAFARYNDPRRFIQQAPQPPHIAVPNVERAIRNFAISKGVDPSKLGNPVSALKEGMRVGLNDLPNTLARAGNFVVPTNIPGFKQPDLTQDLQNLQDKFAKTGVGKNKVVKFVNQNLVNPVLQSSARLADVRSGQESYDKGLKGFGQLGTDAFNVGSVVYTPAKAGVLAKGGKQALKVAPEAAARGLGAGFGINVINQLGEGKSPKDVDLKQAGLAGIISGGANVVLPAATGVIGRGSKAAAPKVAGAANELAGQVKTAVNNIALRNRSVAQGGYAKIPGKGDARLPRSSTDQPDIGLLQSPENIPMQPRTNESFPRQIYQSDSPQALSGTQKAQQQGLLEAKELGSPFGGDHTTKPINVKGPMSDAEYKARYGKERQPQKIDVKPFKTEDYAFAEWKDRSALGLNRETLERNLDLVAGKDAPRIKKFLVDASRKNETARVDFLNETRQRIRKDVVKGLGIRAKSKESSLVQQYGEGMITEQQLRELNPKKADNIIKAAEYFRKEYDTLLDEWNRQRKLHNLDPVPKRKDYFRHFQEISDGISQVGVILNRNELPTSISGITDIFKPNKPFSSAELRRRSNKTTFDAVGGMDNYLEAVSRQIFHTDTVQRGRSIENAIRKQAEDNPEILLPNFVANLGEWVNIVAGKKTRVDRAAEALVGRKIYGLTNWARKRTGANMVGANLASAMSNFVPFTQSLSTTKKVPAIKGFMDALASPLKKGQANSVDGVKSSFLTRRFGDDAIDSRRLKRASEVASTPFRLIDEFTSHSIVAGKYYEGLDQGLSPKEAMKAADDYASKVMADRSIGQTPNVFNSQTMGLLTQFQLEVNNQLSFLGRDIPALAKGSKTKAASSLAQFILYSYLFNEAFEKLTGRRPQIDVVKAILDLKGSPDEDSSFIDRVGHASKNIVEGIPLANLATGGGRLPVSSMLPNVGELTKGIRNIGNNEGKPVGSHLYKGLAGPIFYGVPPFGGGQLRKTAEGIYSLARGESTTPSGRKRFDIEKTPANVIRGVAFGQYATNEGKEYLDTLNKSKSGIKSGGSSKSASKDETGEIIKAAFNSKEGKKFLAIPDDQKTQFVRENPEFRGIYDQYKAMKQAFSAPKLRPEGLDPQAAKVLDRFDRLTPEGKEKVFAQEPDAEYKYNYSKFLSDVAEGKITRVEAIKRKKSLLKDAVGSAFTKDTRDLYSLPKGDLYNFVNNDPDGNNIMNQLLELDRRMVAAGFKSKFYTKSGRFSFGKSGRFSSGKSGGGRRVSRASVAKTPRLRVGSVPKVKLAKAPSTKKIKVSATKFAKLKVSKPKRIAV